MADPVIDYDVAGLRSAATGHAAAADLAARLAENLTRIVIAPADLGGVPAVAQFVAAAQAARDAQAGGARAEGERRADLASRSEAGAQLGEKLIADTAAIADSAAPGTGATAVPVGDGGEKHR